MARPGKARFPASLGEALEEIGFAILVNHGVDPALYEQTDRRIREFFEAIPMEEPEPYPARRHGSVNQGYFPVNETTIIHPDQVEGWVFCRRAAASSTPATKCSAFPTTACRRRPTASRARATRKR